MGDGKVVDQAFDEWFEKWFSDDVVGTLGKVREELEPIHDAIERMYELCPALKSQRDDKALSRAIEKERLRAPLELLGMLEELRGWLGYLRQERPDLVECKGRVEALRHQLSDMLRLTGRLH